MSIDQPSADVSAEDEEFVRRQFEAIAAGVAPDQTQLVRGGLDAGLGLRRRRRLQRGVAAALVVALGTAGIVSAATGLFSNDATPPASRITELVPATARGLDAAVEAELPGSVLVTQRGGAAAGTQAVEADLHVTQGSGSFSLGVAALAPNLLPTTCKDFAPSPCSTRRLPGGMSYLSATFTGTKSAASTGQVVFLHRGSVDIFVFETYLYTVAHPPHLLTSSQLLAIARGPLVGLETTAAMNQAGARFAAFGRSALVLSDVGSESSAGSSGSSGSSRPHRVSPSTTAPRAPR
jgi:hypothetical protein